MRRRPGNRTRDLSCRSTTLQSKTALRLLLTHACGRSNTFAIKRNVDLRKFFFFYDPPESFVWFIHYFFVVQHSYRAQRRTKLVVPRIRTQDLWNGNPTRSTLPYESNLFVPYQDTKSDTRDEIHTVHVRSNVTGYSCYRICIRQYPILFPPRSIQYGWAGW